MSSSADSFRALAVLLHRDADDPDRVRRIADGLLNMADTLDAEDANLICVQAPPPPSPRAISLCGRRADA